MKKIIVYETSDNVLHKSLSEAVNHADKRYGAQLSKMAHELVAIEKYTQMMDKLDSYRGSMQLLIDLAQDLKLESNFDDE